jgi:hypothetical protein
MESFEIYLFYTLLSINLRYFFLRDFENLSKLFIFISDKEKTLQKILEVESMKKLLRIFVAGFVLTCGVLFLSGNHPQTPVDEGSAVASTVRAKKSPPVQNFDEEKYLEEQKHIGIVNVKNEIQAEADARVSQEKLAEQKAAEDAERQTELETAKQQSENVEQQESPAVPETPQVENGPTQSESVQTQPSETEPTQAQPAPAQPVEPLAPQYAPNTLYFAGVAVSYVEGGMAQGQAIIDANPDGIASTWGGAAHFSGTDNMNTHFIGHNVGAFTPVMSLGVGSQITVTDSNGSPFTYTVTSLADTDGYAQDIHTGYNYYDELTGTQGGERITLQTCTNDTVRRLVFAQLS